MNKLLLLGALCFSPTLWADFYYNNSVSIMPTVSYESNALGHLTNVGLIWTTDAGRPQFYQLLTNFSIYQSDDRLLPNAGFTNFDTSLRVGRFDDISVYGELGIALDELAFDSEIAEYYDQHGRYYRENDKVDWFVGAGAGLTLDWLQINAYGRYRYLQSLQQAYLQDPFGTLTPIPDAYQWFAGVELVVRF